MWKWLICVGVVASCIAAMLVRQLWRRGNIDDLCDAASITGAIIGIFTTIVADTLGYGGHEPVTHSWVEELGSACAGAACALSFIAPRVATRSLIIRMLRRRYDNLVEGDRFMMGCESILAYKYKRDGEVYCIFIRFERSYRNLMVLDKDMFVHMLGHTPAVMSSPRLTRYPHGELVALVCERASDVRHIAHFREMLVIATWQLERPVRVIQRAVRRSLSDPSFLMCRRRLQREWHQLAQVSGCKGMWEHFCEDNE